MNWIGGGEICSTGGAELLIRIACLRPTVGTEAHWTGILNYVRVTSLTDTPYLRDQVVFALHESPIGQRGEIYGDS
jgi:hypothetical protein